MIDSCCQSRGFQPLRACGERARTAVVGWQRAWLCAALVFASASAALGQAPPPAQPQQQPQQRLTIGVVEIEGDPRYEPIRGYERLILKTRDHPFAGAQVGIGEAQALTRVLRT